MSNQQHNEKTIFNAALQLPDGEARIAYLKEACGDDLPLRIRVEALLRDHPEVGSFMEIPPTVVVDAAARAKTADSTEQGLTAGTLWAGRYRIVGLLGEGGMGKVYRADDLKLGQSVALKFLPHRLATDALWLVRFRNEVRIAREVAHPNVCRVYDIGEAEGEHFISMEYVDGEDLASLLRRIGRLPQDKAIEIARQLCAGIAAAHDKRVLHRDLKPANIMLDGRGKVRITDFGIAAMVGTPGGDQIRAGTPAYMAPEQMAGTEVTVRSDIYSLGLLLYEIFTGKKAIDADSITQIQRAHERGTPRTPSTHIKDLDPQVERIILQCLEKDPKNRPRSAIAVAAALPGADLLAAAIAAGETPSPEMVAEAGETGALRPAIALPCLAGVVALLVCVVLLKDRDNLLRMVPLRKPPEVLADRAEQISQRLGYTNPPADRAFWFTRHEEYLWQILGTDKSPERWKRLASGRPAALIFHYRAAPSAMTPLNLEGGVNLTDPPFNEPGMMRLQLDTEGRLLKFEAVPTKYEETPALERDPDWSALFAEAELDMVKFTNAAPVWTPEVYCDRRVAWAGTHPWQTNWTMRVEAGSFAGKPVHFAVSADWQKPEPAQPVRAWAEFLDELPWWGPILAVLGVAIYLARRHVVTGRGDRRGATRLAWYVFAVSAAHYLLLAHNVWRLGILQGVLLAAAWKAAASWIFYLALEPYARRYWPHSLVSWSRLLAGRLRDAHIGRDMLVGCLLGVAFAVCEILKYVVPSWTGLPPMFTPLAGELLINARAAAAEFFGVLSGVPIEMGIFLGLLLLRMLLRRQGLALSVFVLSSLLVFGREAISLGKGNWLAPILELLILFASTAIMLVAIVRFGLLAIVVTGLAKGLVTSFPTTFDFSAWWAGPALFGPLCVAALASYGCWTALAGRPLLKDESLAR
jgi:serine/threonine-protein kinase